MTGIPATFIGLSTDHHRPGRPAPRFATWGRRRILVATARPAFEGQRRGTGSDAQGGKAAWTTGIPSMFRFWYSWSSWRSWSSPSGLRSTPID